MSNVVKLSKPFIRETTTSDVLELSQTMRPEDVEELYHSSHNHPLHALSRGFDASSSIFTIEWQGEVVAIFGVVGTPGQGGSPWMLGSPKLNRCWSLLRECRQVLSGYVKEYQYLTNAVWAKNATHIKWLQWLGFIFEGSDLRNGETFLHFHLKDTSYV